MKKIPNQTRSLTIEENNIDVEARTVEVAFSSEAPYERSFGTEVLDHSPQSMRLGRLERGAAVLVNHDRNDQVGVVQSARIDEDRVGRAKIRFSQSRRGQEIFQDVQDGIRSLVSAGYRVHDYDIIERRGETDLIHVTDWEPFELSIVAIPADTSVGVGRSSNNEEFTLDKVKTMTEEVETKEVENEAVRSIDTGAELTKIRKAEGKRVDAIRASADKYELDELGREAISEGWSVEKFNSRALEEVGKKNNEVRAESKHDGSIDCEQRDLDRFSIVRLMRALGEPNNAAAQRAAQHEFEVGNAAADKFGSDFNVRGAYVPTNLLQERALSVGTATAGGNLVATNLMASQYIEVLRNNSALVGAGARMMPGLVGDVAIPRQTGGAASTWISTEDGDATEDQATFDQVVLTPKDLACYTETTRRLTQQATPAIEGIILNDLAISQALGFDLAGLYGTGATGQPTGIANQSGINTLDLAAANPTYAEIVEMIKLVMDNNALSGTPQFIFDPAGWSALSTTPKQAGGVEGNFILSEINDRIKGYGYTMSTQVTAEEYFFGDFSQMLIGEWGGLEINVDPYTHSLKGRVRYVTFKTCDVAVRHPEAFVYAHDGIA